MNCFDSCPYAEPGDTMNDFTGELVGRFVLCSKDDIQRNPATTECPHFVYLSVNDDIMKHGVSSSPDLVPDMVNHPPHYTQGGIECIEAIKAACNDQYDGYLQGQVIKYIWRYRHKAKPVEDLKKARWYLDKLIELEEEKDECD